MRYSKEQRRAIETILDWILNPSFNTFTLAGYAGTGKSSLLGKIRTLLYKNNSKVQVAFASYTGKATQIISHKLHEAKAIYPKDSISTIHSLIYTPTHSEETPLVTWSKKPTLPYTLIIIDEASMVSEQLWKDILSYNIPVLALGDHGQLPPINDSFSLMSNPTLKLEKVHRQAEKHPIIHLSILARNEGYIPIKEYSSEVIKLQKGSQISQRRVIKYLKSLAPDSMMLCGYNSTRVSLNRSVKKIRRQDTESPVIGETVICLRNNHQEGLYNGMVGQIQEISSFDSTWYQTQIHFPSREIPYLGYIHKHQFNAPKTFPFQSTFDGDVLGDLFDFGYAMTTHKAQGSQAREVLLFEERFPQMTDDVWRKWLYTAITRATDKLTIIGS